MLLFKAPKVAINRSAKAFLVKNCFMSFPESIKNIAMAENNEAEQTITKPVWPLNLAKIPMLPKISIAVKTQIAGLFIFLEVRKAFLLFLQHLPLVQPRFSLDFLHQQFF